MALIELRSLGQMMSLIDSKTIVTVIDFNADWCGPCQQIKPEYERIAQFYDRTKVAFCSCNVDRARACAQRFQVTSIPTFMVFYAGETIGTIRGGDLGLVQRNIDMGLSLLESYLQSHKNAANSSSAHAGNHDSGHHVGSNDDNNYNVEMENEHDEVKNKLAHLMLRLHYAKQNNNNNNNNHNYKNTTVEHDVCKSIYELLLEHTENEPFGLALLPYLASEAYSNVALDCLFVYLDMRSQTPFAPLRSAPSSQPHHKHQLNAVESNLSGSVIVNQLLRYTIEILSTITWDDINLIELTHKVILNMLQCTHIQPLLVASPFFYSALIMTGQELERNTLLGAFLGVSPIARAATIPQTRQMIEFETSMKLFPSSNAEECAKSIYQTQQMVELLHKLNYTLVRVLLRSKLTRDATIAYFGHALQLNVDYQKTMHTHSPLSSRYFMTQLQGVLISAALPMFDRGFNPSSIPPYYLLPLEEDQQQQEKEKEENEEEKEEEQQHERNGDSSPPTRLTVVDFGKDVERIAHYDSEHPLPNFPREVQQVKPFVHLFYLATRAITLCATVFTDEHERDERTVNSGQVSGRQRDVYVAEKSLYEALLAGPEMGRERLQFLNSLAQWLLFVIQASPTGVLPPCPPEEWNYLPQQVVDAVIRATRLIPVDNLHINNLIALMLVLMGNTQYFPKPHTHALFPTFLMRMMEDYQSRQALEQHPWFSDHIVRGCIKCYIAVEKSIYERVNVRYELSYCMKNFLNSETLCAPVREEFEQKDTVLERFSHMAVTEVNEAVDQLIEILTKMNEMMNSGANTSVEALPEPANRHSSNEEANDHNGNNNNTSNNNLTRRQGQGQGQGNRRSNRNRNNNNSRNNHEVQNDGDGEENEDEDEDEEEKPATYHQMGLRLRSHIMLFNASIDMFMQLAVQFPKGVSQNMVAMQISQMLARSFVAFCGSKSKNLKIEHAERYGFRPREILARLVNCLTTFRRSNNFLRCLSQCDIPLTDIRAAMDRVVTRQLVNEELVWKLQEVAAALDKVSSEVDAEEELWSEAPDYAIDALLYTPLTDPVALPATVKDYNDLVYVNRSTIHHYLLSESKHPFTKSYLDEAMVNEFNARPEVTEARNKLKESIRAWLREAKCKKEKQNTADS